jgi:epoxyqueuosine reductase
MGIHAHKDGGIFNRANGWHLQLQGGKLMSPKKPDRQIQASPAELVEEEIKSFVRSSPLNRLPPPDEDIIYDEPLVGFADGDDPIFIDYKKIIAPTHLTPREALAMTYHASPEDMPARLSVISWVLPVMSQLRKSNHKNVVNPSRLWACVEHYGEYVFLESMYEHIVKYLTKKKYLAVAPAMESYFKDTMMDLKIKGEELDIVKIKQCGISNWSEKHIAYAAGLGTLSYSGNFISERGVAVHIGSVVTSLVLPATQRTTSDPYANCLLYATGKCKACAERCPIGAITEDGHDDIKCANRMFEIQSLGQEYKIERVGCGMCMTKVPCEFVNPVKNIK